MKSYYFRNITIRILFFFVAQTSVLSQNVDARFEPPFDFPILLSGNFAELRSNHFHGGIDFKTGGVTGKAVHAPADGYISRATVSAGGYGNAIYIVHTNGYTTIHGHLDRFTPLMEQNIKNHQYSEETFAVDMNFETDEFRVKAGDVVAYSGNTGYSFGPHLHMEIRETSTGDYINPMLFYKREIRDTKPPLGKSILIQPRAGRGVVNGSNSKIIENIIDNATISGTIKAWGEVGIGIMAFDYMDNTSNNYGVYSIELKVDDRIVYNSKMDRYTPDENRLINAWTDYENYYYRGAWYMKSFILPNNPLSMLESDENRGWIDINENRIYRLEYSLVDMHGNTSNYGFNIVGEKQPIESLSSRNGHYLCYDRENELRDLGMVLTIPEGELFEDAILHVKRDGGVLSDKYDLGGICYPIWRRCKIAIKMKKTATYDLGKYYLKRVTYDGSASVGGEIENGWMVADISQLGCYEIGIDTLPPLVEAFGQNGWKKSGVVSFSLRDRETGIKSFKGRLDGKFILFQYSAKNARLTCDLKNEGIKHGEHNLELSVVDNSDNETLINKTIIY